jgi:hypothetical protein
LKYQIGQGLIYIIHSNTAAAQSAGKGANILHHAVGELRSPPEESEFVRETPAENATPAAGAGAFFIFIFIFASGLLPL